MKKLYLVFAVVSGLISLVIFEVNQNIESKIANYILGTIDYVMMFMLPYLFISLYFYS